MHLKKKVETYLLNSSPEPPTAIALQKSMLRHSAKTLKLQWNWESLRWTLLRMCKGNVKDKLSAFLWWNQGRSERVTRTGENEKKIRILVHLVPYAFNKHPTININLDLSGVTYQCYLRKRETANDSTSFIGNLVGSESESSGKIDIYFGWFYDFKHFVMCFYENNEPNCSVQKRSQPKYLDFKS